MIIGKRKLVERIATKGRQSGGAAAALAIGAALYLFFALTTSRIPGYGADGQSYATMAKAFDVTQLSHMPSIIGPHNARYLPSAIAHYIDSDPVVAFTLMNMFAIAGAILAYYGILRFYELPIKWALVAIVLFLITWPALRFWIFYPVLTDQVGAALLLGTIWTILKKRYLLYSLLAAALMATRENGVILLVFFVLFHLNPWNPHRDKQGHPMVRIVRLTAWNLLPLLALLQVSHFPIFPQSNNWDAVDYTRRVVIATLGSVAKQHQMLLSLINCFGILLYILGWGLFQIGLRRILVILRSNIHWIWCVLINIVFAPLSRSDHERFLLIAVPVLALACTGILRELKVTPKVALALVILVVVSHAYLSHAFAPLNDVNDYFQFFAATMSANSDDAIVRTHLWLASALAVLLFIKLIRNSLLRSQSSARGRI